MVEESEKIDCEIPCEFCDKPVKFDDYDRHIKSCSKNPDLINQDKVGIPCEFCKEEIPFEDYTKHSESHYQSRSQPKPGGFQQDQVRYTPQQQNFPMQQQPFSFIPYHSQTQMAASQGSYGQGRMQPAAGPMIMSSNRYAAGPDRMTRSVVSNNMVDTAQPNLFNLLMGPRLIIRTVGGQGTSQQQRVVNLNDLFAVMMGQDDEGRQAFLMALGVRPSDQGFNKEDLDNNFFTAKFDKSKSEGLEEENKKCSICLSDFEDGEELRFLECCHRFHTKCIDHWMKSKTTCPICKKDFKNFDANPEDNT